MEAAGRAILSGWVTQGPEVAAFEREFAAFVGAPHACAVSNCTTALHLALAGRRRRARRRGHHRQPLLHRHRQRDPLLRRHAGLRGHRAGHLQHRPRADRGAPSRRARGRSSCVHQIGMPCDLAAHPRPSRGATACRVVEDAACAIGSEILLERPLGDDRPAARRRRLLLLPPAQAGHHRRRRHDHHGQRRAGTGAFRLLRQHGMSVPDTVRHGAEQVIFESYPDARLQLPHDGHPGGRRPGAAQAPAGDRRAPAARWPRATATAWRRSRGSRSRSEPAWARTQLAELLRAAARPLRPAAA